MKSIHIITALLILPATSALGRVVCEQCDDHIVVTRDGYHVLTYHKTVQIPAGVEAKYGRSGFIHPISTPSGRVITDDYPLPHHGHQHGVYFAWRSTTFEDKQMNFWEHGKETVRHDKVLEIMNKKRFAGFRVQLAHVSGTRKILREIWTVMVYSDTGYIDLTSEQRCATESPITLERFHYGGMAVRGSRQWFKDAHTSAGKGALKDEFVESCKMITNEGLTLANGNHSQPNWVCMTGAIDAAPVSITFVPHPTNFRHPQYVRLHPDMPYFCFIPTVEKPFDIEPGKPLVSRYRIIAEDGEPDTAKLNAVQQAFALEK
ncbi:PmoA family protein [Planctomycetota bacterium]